MKFAGLIFAVIAALPSLADEGLWPYNQFPQAAVKQKYGFDASPAFLDHLRLASVRLGEGSGAFVSPSGLLLTSRGAAAGCFSGAGSSDRNFMRDGFSGEMRCAGLSASVLLKIEDVSAQLKSAGQSLAQRNAAIARIERDCAASTHNVCSVVRLFSGGRYDLYQYKRYSDVRLIFAPEYSAAFFGKEHDSIGYLRYGLNIAVLRAYEDGEPARTPDYLKWSSDGVKEGDLVFAAGNPGPTSRLATAAQLTFIRDTALPLKVQRLQSRIRLLNMFDDPAAAQAILSSLLLAYKSDAGKLIGLRDDRLVARKTYFEQKIRRAVETDPKLGASAAKVWDEVAAAYKKWTPFEKAYQIIEADPAPGSRLFRTARQTLRGETPDVAAAAVNERIEILMLTQYLEELKTLGEKEAPVKAILAGRTPAQAAEAMVKSHDVAHLATLLDAPALRLRKLHDETIGSLEVSAAEKIAQYRLRLFGATDYPDGTSTPRVEFGTVGGYTDRAAVPQPFASTFSGLFYRAENDGPWQIGKKWVEVRPTLHEVTPLDFVSTCDTGGGDYGSPAVNRAGELVGVTFDGNLESLPNVFLYSGEQARAVHVDVRGIAEALDKVYTSGALLRELGLRPVISGTR